MKAFSTGDSEILYDTDGNELAKFIIGGIYLESDASMVVKEKYLVHLRCVAGGGEMFDEWLQRIRTAFIGQVLVAEK